MTVHIDAWRWTDLSPWPGRHHHWRTVAVRGGTVLAERSGQAWTVSGAMTALARAAWELRKEWS